MPFWSKGKSPKRLDPEKYFPRSQQRMELVAQEEERLVRLWRQGRLNTRALTYISTRIRKLEEEQRNEVVPLPSLEEHKQGYLRIMDIQARKAEDILATGGENLEAIFSEEQGLQQQTNEQQGRTEDEFQNKWGRALPDFSDLS